MFAERAVGSPAAFVNSCLRETDKNAKSSGVCPNSRFRRRQNRLGLRRSPPLFAYQKAGKPQSKQLVRPQNLPKAQSQGFRFLLLSARGRGRFYGVCRFHNAAPRDFGGSTPPKSPWASQKPASVRVPKSPQIANPPLTAQSSQTERDAQKPANRNLSRWYARKIYRKPKVRVFAFCY